jgi:hypothetical protein
MPAASVLVKFWERQNATGWYVSFPDNPHDNMKNDGEYLDFVRLSFGYCSSGSLLVFCKNCTGAIFRSLNFEV